MTGDPRPPNAGGLRGFMDGLQLQGIVIGAVMMREIQTRYGRDNLGFLWLIAEPLLFCLGVVAIWAGAHGHDERGIPIVAFVITGYVPLVLWRHIVFRSVHCFRSNAALLYHRQLRMLDLLVARFALEFCGNVMAFLVVAFIFGALGLYQPPKDFGLFYLGWLYCFLYPVGLGLIIGCISEKYEWFEKLVGPITYFQLPISGAFFMVDWLPGSVQKYALLMPSIDAYEMIRAGQFGPAVEVHYDLAYTTFACSALIAVGLMLCRRVHQHLVIA
jgi:capsular polysaccharide transport system permease protein